MQTVAFPPLENSEYIRINAIRLPFPDENFDLMVTDQLLGSSPREDELLLLEEIQNLLGILLYVW